MKKYKEYYVSVTGVRSRFKSDISQIQILSHATTLTYSVRARGALVPLPVCVCFNTEASTCVGHGSTRIYFQHDAEMSG
jgi:hypothetical protein